MHIQVFIHFNINVTVQLSCPPASLHHFNLFYTPRQLYHSHLELFFLFSLFPAKKYIFLVIIIIFLLLFYLFFSLFPAFFFFLAGNLKQFQIMK